MALNRDLINFSDASKQADDYVIKLKKGLAKLLRDASSSRVSSTVTYTAIEIAQAEGERDGLVTINKATTDPDMAYDDILKAIFNVAMGGVSRLLTKRDPVELAYLDGRRFAANLAMRALENAR